MNWESKPPHLWLRLGVTTLLWGGALVVLSFTNVLAQQSMFKSEVVGTSLGSNPNIGGVPAHDFEWDATGKANIFAQGDLEVKIEDLNIADTDGVAPELEGTAGNSDFFCESCLRQCSCR